MKKEVKSIGLLCAAVFGLSSALKAQAPADTGRVQLKEVVITATRSEENPVDVPRSVTVISGDSIRNSGVTSLGELLSQQEGLFVMGSGQNPGQIQSVYARGAGANQAVILLDGVRISDPSTNDNAVDLTEISLADIDRIEIVRGSHSTLYGSSAIGGVINIITKGKADTPGVHLDAAVTAGTFGTPSGEVDANVALNYTHQSGFYAGAEIYTMNVKGLDATVDTVSNPLTYQETHRDNDDFVKNDYVAKLGFQNEKLDVRLSGRFSNQHAEVDKGAFTDDDNYTVEFRRITTTGNIAYHFSDRFSATLIGGATMMQREAIDDSSLVDGFGTTDHTYFSAKYAGGTATGEAQVNYRRPGLDLVAGGGYFTEQMTAKTYYFSNGFFGPYESTSDLDTLNISVGTAYEFVHAGLSGELINEKYARYRLSLGLRNVNHELFGSALTYEIAPSVKLNDNALLYASYSTGFNAPSLYQLYSPEADFSSGITRGNKTLAPETSVTFEIGFKQRISGQFSFGVSYFHTVVEHSIDYVYLWNKDQEIDSLSYLDYRGDTYINIGKQTNQGMEISVLARLTGKLTVQANLSLVSGRLEYDPASIDTAHTHGNHVQLYSNGAFITKQVEAIGLVRRPGTGNIVISYLLLKDKLRLTLAARYVGPRADVYYASQLGPFGALATSPVGDYTLIDLGARYQVTKKFSAQLLAKNVFDVKYSEIFGYTTRGRGFYLNLRYSF